MPPSSICQGGALVAGAGLRLLQRPGLHRYAASLPVAAVLPPALGEPSRVVRGGGSLSLGEHRIYEHAVAGLVIIRTCNDECTGTQAFTGCDPGGHAELWTMEGGAHSPSQLSDDFAVKVIDFLFDPPKP